jgi:hypothetical protein
MSPKDPDPIFLPKRYLFPTRSSILDDEGGRRLGWSVGRQIRGTCSQVQLNSSRYVDEKERRWKTEEREREREKCT